MTTTEQITHQDVAFLEEKPPMTAIILYNDDYTTMEFVVWVLMTVLHLDEATAVMNMMAIHQTGRACVAMLPQEIAETKAYKIIQLAEQQEYPLVVTLEPA